MMGGAAADGEVFRTRSATTLRKHFNTLSHQESSPVFRVVLTGGPCAGKTTALAVLEERMRSRGFRTFMVPEAASMLFGGGFQFSDLIDDTKVKLFQTTLLKTQMYLEDSFQSLAVTCGKPSIIICDRGTMDGSAYMARPQWLHMLEDCGFNEVLLRDQRYDGVLHLVTAADGAREFYTLENNKSRRESYEEAIAVDRKLRNAWIGHPRLRVIDNRSDFNEKMNRVVNALCNVVGLPQIPEISRKFVVRGDIQKLSSAAGWLQEFDVDQTILVNSGQYSDESVRRRGHRGVFSYVYRVRKVTPGGEPVEIKRSISEREYVSLLSHADPGRKTLRIKRRCFMYEDTYFVLDFIHNIDPPVTLLRTQTESEDTELSLPRFIELDEDVTGDERYTVRELSLLANSQRRFEYESRKKASANLETRISTSL